MSRSKLYWQIGKDIIHKQERFGWGKSVVLRLSAALKEEFPPIKGFSVQNLWYMRSFYLAWRLDASKLQQGVGVFRDASFPSVLGELPWGQNIVLFEKIKDAERRIWYARQTLRNEAATPQVAAARIIDTVVILWQYSVT